MNKKVQQQLKRRKKKLQRRLARKVYPDQPKPAFTASNIHYELADKAQAINCGGIGAIHAMNRKIGLINEIDEKLDLLSRHVPYHESDHVLNMAYNIMVGNQRLEDLELLRNNETYMDALGAARIPDPTTAGDFTRRFGGEDIDILQECANAARQNVWRQHGQGLLNYAVIDVDGTLAGTLGECKGGIDIAYNGIWGYGPLIVTLANTGEVLYIKNRPANRPSHDGAATYMTRAVDLVRPYAEKVCLRGDTDFSSTAHLDGWDEAGVDFAFGMNAHKKLTTLAEALPQVHWSTMERPAKYTVETETRARPDNVKQSIIKQRKYKNLTLEHEEVAEFEYRPLECKQEYRMVVVRKTIRVEQGQERLFDEVRHLFYITNRRDLTATEVVLFCNDRCNQENTIEQLKNGVNAMRLPVTDLLSNWAYMVICGLAWSMKAWFAMYVRNKDKRSQLLRMEFRQFVNQLMRIPCQIVRTGRKIIYRFLGQNEWTEFFFQAFDRIRMQPAQ